MRRRAPLAALITVAVLAAGPHGPAAAATQEVSAQFAAFGPTLLDVLPGEAVVWTNVSDRTHTVTSDTGLFASDELAPGQQFSLPFGDLGAYPYHCTIHAGMVGEIDVRAVILGPVPTAPVPAGDHVDLDGRTADTSRPVRVERSTDGTTFTPVASATPAPDGTWHAAITATSTADYRATSGDEPSQTRRLLVSDRKVLIHATRAGVSVTVVPSKPYARILLQEDSRDHFGWWPLRATRLDYVSRADLPVRRPARVRVLLVDRDGWTPLATSNVVVLRR
jgi:plastocyanin